MRKQSKLLRWPIEREREKARVFEESETTMPCLNLSTNVSLEGVDTSSILSEATSAVAKLIGKPEAVRYHFRSFINLNFYCFFIYVFLVVTFNCALNWDELDFFFFNI